MTKKQSSALYGIAILLMLYFHLFGAPGLTNVQYTSVLCFGKVVNLERRWHLCVYQRLWIVLLYAENKGARRLLMAAIADYLLVNRKANFCIYA